MVSSLKPDVAGVGGRPEHHQPAAANKAATFMAFSNVVGAHIAPECKLCQHLGMDKSAYHHGDLKSALIAAALAAVEQGGAEAVSLRDLAQSLGVSRARRPTATSPIATRCWRRWRRRGSRI